jgi:phage gp36-like protein
MYCTQAAYAARFGSKELTELLPDTEDRTYAVCAADTDALIDGYIGGRFTLPFATTPKLITAIAADLVRYELYQEAPTKEVTERRKLALKLLEDIRDGLVVLAGVSITAADAIAVRANDRVFTEDLGAAFVGEL